MMKANIISGLLLFSISIFLGPYMMRGLPGEEGQVKAQTELREAFGALAASRANTEGSAPDLARATARATQAHLSYDFAGFRRQNISFTHAHGNLQGMLNILVGLFLAKLAVSRRIQLAVSWGFIAGSWIMVGALFSGNILGLRWALSGMLPGGLILAASLVALTLLVIIKGFKDDTSPT